MACHAGGVPSATTSNLAVRVSKALAVSVTTTVLSTAILVVLTYTATTSPGNANAIATIAGIPPSYVLNRRWVWKPSGPSRFTSQTLPFAAMCVFSLVASTFTVSLAGSWSDTQSFSATTRLVFVVATNLATFGCLWIAQFLLLDRVLFRSASSVVISAQQPSTKGRVDHQETRMYSARSPKGM
jgi:putative flippase GtrA